MLDEITDIYIPQEGVDQFYAFREGRLLSMKSAPALKPILELLLIEVDGLNMKAGDDDFINYKELQYRVHLESRKTDNLYSLRKIPNFKPSLIDTNCGLSFPPQMKELVDEGLKIKGGLYLICGPLGSGKTTTSAALFNHILTTKGGVGWALEHPPEYNLEGEYGEQGIGYQHAVKDGDFSRSIRSMMRCYPSGAESLMLIGEVRDTATAKEVIKALFNGTRVIFTLHAGTAIEAITRFLTLCESQNETSREILSNSLRLIIAQQQGSSLSNKAKINYDYLVGDSSVKASILQGKYESLKDIQISQKNIRLANQLQVRK